MVSQVLECLAPKPGGIYVDGTLGLGGHAKALLHRFPDIGLLVGLEWDSAALEIAQERLKEFREKVRFIRANFAMMPDVLYAEGLEHVDGIVLDLGLSSF